MLFDCDYWLSPSIKTSNNSVKPSLCSNQMEEGFIQMLYQFYLFQGCYPELLRVVSEYSVAVGAVTATALAVQLLDIICACCVITNINANKVGAV